MTNALTTVDEGAPAQYPAIEVHDNSQIGAISFFPLIDGVKRLVILGEAGEASAKAIKICGKRWCTKARRRVRVVMPNEAFADLNDVLIARASP